MSDVKYILFDLDGTLLPMDQDVFVRAYFKLLTKKMLPYGYEAKALIDGVWAGTEAMTENDGSRTNEEAFWQRFAEFAGVNAMEDKPVFEEFYRVEFQRAASSCGYNPEAAATVALCRELGYRVVLAVNPLFPLSAMVSRLKWAGVDPAVFERITSYENSSYAKPNPEYYRELLRSLGAAPEECVMVGNDVKEDMAAETLGVRCFLLTDCLINPDHADVSRWEHGGFPLLQNFLRNLK